jgi:hypothetical protein
VHRHALARVQQPAFAWPVGFGSARVVSQQHVLDGRTSRFGDVDEVDVDVVRKVRRVWGASGVQVPRFARVVLGGVSVGLAVPVPCVMTGSGMTSGCMHYVTLFFRGGGWVVLY